jgi:hypothetical protein
MNFRKATDELLASISHEELAKALGVSVATVRQARLGDDAKAHRSPPEGWEGRVLKLAEMQADRLRRLAAKLRSSGKTI